MRVVVHRLDTFEAIFEQTKIVTFSDRLQEVRFLFRVTQCSFPVAGAYQASLVADGESIAQHKFYVA